MKKNAVTLLCILPAVVAFSSIAGPHGGRFTTRRTTAFQRAVFEDGYGYAEQGLGMDIAPIMPMEAAEPGVGGGLSFRSGAYNDMAREGRRDMANRFYNDGPELLPDSSMLRSPRSNVAPYLRDSAFYDRRGSENTIQGNSRNSYSTRGGSHLVELGSATSGRPIHATVETWVGPDNTPQKIKLYSQDGSRYRIRTVTSSNDINTVSVKNEGNLAYPLQTHVTPVPYELQQAEYDRISGMTRDGSPQGIKVQGEGAVKTFPIPARVSAVLVTLQTQGLPLNAKMEILEGPNNVKLSAEVYNDGLHGPAQLILDAPEGGYTSCTLRIENNGPMSYPFSVMVEPYEFGGPDGGRDGYGMSRFDDAGRFREGDPYYEGGGGGLDYRRAYPRRGGLYTGRYNPRLVEPGW